jgi:hypothetical protein
VVFRAQDELLPELLVAYWRMCEMEGSPQHHLDGITATKRVVEDWQADHHTQVPQSAAQAPS